MLKTKNVSSSARGSGSTIIATTAKMPTGSRLDPRFALGVDLIVPEPDAAMGASSY